MRKTTKCVKYIGGIQVSPVLNYDDLLFSSCNADSENVTAHNTASCLYKKNQIVCLIIETHFGMLLTNLLQAFDCFYQDLVLVKVHAYNLSLLHQYIYAAI